MTLPLFEPTYTVSQLGGEIRDFLRQSFDSFWVMGEVQRARPSRNGHLYFELVEKGGTDDSDEIVGKLDCVLWRTEHERVRRVLAQQGVGIADGVALRCRAAVDFYPAGGRLQLVVREVDPVFALGVLEQRRRETLAALEAAGLLELQAGLELGLLPLRVGLVSSEGSAAYHDFLATLRESGYGFQVVFAHAAVQGRDAERQVVAALGLLAEMDVQAIALVRGGGSRSDLAAFDSRSIAEAVARMPRPVLTGLGHEIDESVADRVAHTRLKTPTKAAEFLVERVRAAEERLLRLRQTLLREADEPLLRAARRVDAALGGVRLAGARLHAARARLDERAARLARVGHLRLERAAHASVELRRRLAFGGLRCLERGGERPRLLSLRIADLARGRVRERAAVLDGVARLVASLDPQRTLRRGYTITRTARGRLVRAPGEVRAGEVLSTETAGGALRSRVEEP